MLSEDAVAILVSGGGGKSGTRESQSKDSNVRRLEELRSGEERRGISDASSQLNVI